VRQGGILSPALFAAYIDPLIARLQSMKFGCHINCAFFGCLLYADDILLLSPSIKDLQNMLHCCYEVLGELGMSVNVSKSGYMRVGKRYKNVCASLFIGKHPVQHLDKIKYLGVVFIASKFLRVDFEPVKRAFYRAFNTIFSRSRFAESEHISIHLLNSICTPLLLYALEVLAPTSSTLKMLDNVIAKCVGKIFSTYDMQTIDACRKFLGVQRLEILYLMRVCNFMRGLKYKSDRRADFIFEAMVKECASTYPFNMCGIDDFTLDTLHSLHKNVRPGLFRCKTPCFVVASYRCLEL
jgi:hypothetical protein